MRAFIVGVAVALAACSGHAAHKGDGAEAEDELPAVAATLWTKKGELFIEYSPLIVGTPSRFLAHVTVLSSFKPVRKGRATITLTMADGTKQEASASPPKRPGIFIPTITPKVAGTCHTNYECSPARDPGPRSERA